MAHTATPPQIYLTARQRERLDARARVEHKTMTAIIREAIDSFVGPSSDLHRQAWRDATLGQAPGLRALVPSRDEWAGRDARRHA